MHLLYSVDLVDKCTFLISVRFRKHILSSWVYYVLTVKHTHSYKHNRVYTTSFTHRMFEQALAHNLMFNQLSGTVDRCQQKLSGLSTMADDCRVVECELEDHGLFFCLPSLNLLFFSNPPFPGVSVIQIILGHRWLYSMVIAFCMHW